MAEATRPLSGSAGEATWRPPRFPSKRVRRGEGARPGAGREERPQPVLLRGGGLVEGAQGVVEAVDVVEPRHAQLREVVAPHARAGEVAGHVEQPARRHPVATAPEVAAGEAEHLAVGGGDGGEEVAVLAGDTVAPEREQAVDGATLGVGQEGVVPGRAGGQTLGQPDHHHQVEVEADPHREGPDEHAVAEAPDPPGVGLELDLEGAHDDVEPDRSLDLVEGGEAVDRQLDPLGGPTLDLVAGPVLPLRRRAQQAVEERPGPPAVLGPGPRSTAGPVEVVGQLGDEGPQAPGVVGLAPVAGGGCGVPVGGGLVGADLTALGLGEEAAVPLVAPGDHTGLARDALPGRHRDGAPGEPEGGGADPVEDGLAAPALRGQGQQPDEGATGGARRQRDG